MSHSFQDISAVLGTPAYIPYPLGFTEQLLLCIKIQWASKSSIWMQEALCHSKLLATLRFLNSFKIPFNQLLYHPVLVLH